MGTYSDLILRDFRKCRVLMFEPQNSIFKKIKKKYKGQKNIKIYNYAISDKSTLKTIYINRHDLTSGLSTFNKKSSKKSLSLTLRNYFIAGVVVLIPIGITLYLTKFIIQISSNIIPKEINPNHYLPFSIPGLEIIISVLLITLIGWLSLSFLGRKVINFVNDVFKRIPFLRTIYSAIGQMTQSFAKNKKNKKKSVVLVEYPRKGSWAVGFATQDNKGEIQTKANKKLVIVKNGDHSLSDSKSLKKMKSELSRIIKNIS